MAIVQVRYIVYDVDAAVPARLHVRSVSRVMRSLKQLILLPRSEDVFGEAVLLVGYGPHSPCLRRIPAGVDLTVGGGFEPFPEFPDGVLVVAYASEG